LLELGTRVLGDPERLSRLLEICHNLPEVVVSGDQHLAFCIGKKTFAYYQDDHHGDGVVCINCKSTHERQRELVSRFPDRYLVPAYTGPRGWVALRLDLPEVDWKEVRSLLIEAYRLQAPRRLVGPSDCDPRQDPVL
jgi:hypothetical protein